MKTKEQIEELIKSIVINKANLEHISEKGKINGSLLISIRNLIQQELEEKDKVIRELVNKKAKKETIYFGVCDICEKQNSNKSTWRSCSNCGEFFKQTI